MTHDELIDRGRRWLASGGKHAACPVVITDMTTGASETPDVLGWNGKQSILIEAKTSRADYRADQKKYFRRMPSAGVGTHRYYLPPPGLLSADDLPAGWGLLEAHPRFVRTVRESGFFQAAARTEVQMLVSLVRRLGQRSPLEGVAIKVYQWHRPEPRATVTIYLDEAIG